MSYNYDTPQEAIISLEMAYTNHDLQGIITSKDFEGEAKLLLMQASPNYDINDTELILETAKLVELSLIKHLQDEGYPDFANVERSFSELKKIDENLFFIEETLRYPNGDIFINDIYLSIKDNKWKIVMAE